ncbi:MULTISPECIES: hypothetical protein [Bacillaceae]|nr:MULTISPECIES: hypothetical protein [Bacillaceae]SFC95526.1 hypothetical protein SAMN02799633_02132 [Bacillus sp. UNCCL81]
MGLKRKNKRKSTQPHTKVVDFGMGKTLAKIEKAIRILEKK